MSQTPMPIMAEAIALSHPVTLATFARYTDAQRAVDYLSDQEFPVENCMIVGTDLRQLERVTGRLTQQKVAFGGLASGAWLGLFVGLVLSMFDGQGMRPVVTTILFGALFGVVWALLGYAMTRGRRDFTSVTQVVATRYEVLVEHTLLGRAREVLGGLPNNGLHRPVTPPVTAPGVPGPGAQTGEAPTADAWTPAPVDPQAPASPVDPVDPAGPAAPEAPRPGGATRHDG